MQPLAGLAVGFGLGRIGIDDEIDHAAEVVDDGQLVHHQQQQVGHTDGVGFLDIADLGLDEVHHVVAEITGQTTAEARQPGQQVDAVAALVLLHEGQRIALDGLDHLAITHHLDMGALGADGGAGRQADEGIASETLAAHHGFEQEGISTVGGVRQLEIEAERAVQIGQRLQHDGDAVITLCCQRLEFEFGHLRCLGKICRTGKSIPVCRHMDVSSGNTCSRTTSPCPLPGHAARRKPSLKPSPTARWVSALATAPARWPADPGPRPWRRHRPNPADAPRCSHRAASPPACGQHGQPGRH